MASLARKATAATFTAALLLGGLTACSDEDGDGARTDEEIGELEDTGEDIGNQIEQEVDKGQEEIEDE